MIVIALKLSETVLKFLLCQIVTGVGIETPIDQIRDLVLPPSSDVIKCWIVVKKRSATNKESRENNVLGAISLYTILDQASIEKYTYPVNPMQSKLKMTSTELTERDSSRISILRKMIS
jgi:hypothetical protein